MMLDMSTRTSLVKGDRNAAAVGEVALTGDRAAEPDPGGVLLICLI